MANAKVVLNNEVLMDITDTTATASDVAEGKILYTADGLRTVGTGAIGGGVPSGGAAGEILTKVSSTDYDVSWQSAPVISVNGKTGVITLSASDVGALPSSTAIPSAYMATPASLGTASAGSSPSWARGDHVHPKPTYSKSDVGLGNVDNVKQYSSSNPPPYPVTSVNGQTGAVTVQTATDAQVTNAVNTWLGENVAQETGYVLDSTLTMSNAAPPASAVGDLKSVIENVKPPLSYVINMWDYFWAGGTEILSSRVTNDAMAESLYLVVSGQDGATALTVDESSPLSLSDMETSVRRGIIEYPDGSVDLVSLCVIDNTLDVYPPLKMAVSAVKIYSEGVSIHLSKAGYKYYANSFFNADKKYAQKRKAIAQYNPYTDPQPTNPLTKIGSFWWGKGVENIVAPNRRVAEHATKNYLNLSFVTGASAASPKGFEWEMVLNGKSGYFEMYLGGRDTDALTAEFATGLEFNIEFYLDGVLSESIVKKTKKCEPIRFDFADAQTGKVRMYTTGGASTYAAFLSQATWWETDEPHGMIFKTYKVPCMLMDSWGVYKDNEVQSVLETLLTVNGMSGYVVNNSLGSMTSNWGVENFYPKAWAEHPDYMITDFQINDINTGVTEAQYIQNMTNIVDASLATRIAPVLLLSAHVTMTGVYCLYTFPLITALTDIS